MSLPPLVNLELYRGDDAEPIVLRVRGNAWDLTAAALAMSAQPEQGRGEPLHLDGSHIKAVRDDEGDVLITLDIPAALTRDITWQAAHYDLQATQANGRVKTLCRGRLLIVEDIIDTGRTLSYLIEIFKYRKAKSIKVVTLMDKKERRVVDLEADYIGINVPNEFVVGYGLDFNEKYRNLPYIGILKTEVYE